MTTMMMTKASESKLDTWLSASLAPINNSSVVFFRVAFGALMASWAWDYLSSGRVTTLYVEPQFHFTYAAFSWVKAWSGTGMYWHFLLMVAASLAVSIGFYYRIAATVLAVSFTYFFLIERTNYQNHYYLLTLFCWCMVLLPLNRRLSWDAAHARVPTEETTPAWVLWLLRFHVGIPYFFGGIAKLTPDWLIGQPLGIMLSGLRDFPVLGPLLAWGPSGIIASYFAIFFDLSIVPALLFKPTRKIAYAMSIVFHCGNAVFFDIHVFPWFMIVATTLFFEPDWVAELLRQKPVQRKAIKPVAGQPTQPVWQWTGRRKIIFGAFACYVLFHCLWPLRHNLYAGETSWSERGHLFAWRMMLRGKEVGIGYAVRDPATGTLTNVDFKQYLADEQAAKFPRDPALILQMAHFIASDVERQSGRRPEVYAFVLASLNGRKPQFMIDPTANLAAQSAGLFRERPWVMPLTEPLRFPPWDMPVERWREVVEIPRGDFNDTATASALQRN